MRPDLNVPPGYVELLQEFTIAVLRTKPNDIATFAAEYFGQLVKERRKSMPKQANETSKPNNTVRKPNDEKKPFHVNTPPINGRPEDDDPSFQSDESPPHWKHVRGRRPSVSAERFDPDEEDDDDEPEKLDEIGGLKSAEEIARLKEVFKKILLFRHMEDNDLEKVISVMSERRVLPEEIVIKQGEEGDHFYVIESGIYQALIEDNDGNSKLVYTYDNQGSFGELALMYNAPRSATVQAKTSGRLWCMNRSDFKRYVLKISAKQRRLFTNLLHSVSILQDLSPYERMNLADALGKRTYEPDQSIIEQGEPGAEMFFIMEGVAVVSRKFQGDDGQETEQTLTELKVGQYFGELALLSNQPRAATVRAQTKVQVAVLDKESFERLLGPCIEVMKRNAEKYSELEKLHETAIV